MLELFTLAMVLEGVGGEISPAGAVRNPTRLQANLRRRFHLHLHLVSLLLQVSQRFGEWWGTGYIELDRGHLRAELRRKLLA